MSGISLGLGIGLARQSTAAAAASAIEFVGDGATAKELSSNSLAVDYPSGIEAGDLLVMHVMHRSTLTTPNGWSKHATSGATATSSQQTSVLTKVADGTETGTVTINQATGARFMGQITALRGTWTYITATSGVVNSNPSGPMPTGPVSVSDGYAFAAVSYVITDTSNPVTNSVESGWTMVGTETQTDNRLAVAYRDCTGGHTEDEVDLSQSYSTTTDYAWTVLVIGTDAVDFGPELLTNGDFATDVSNWTAASAATLTWDAGAMEVSLAGGDSFGGGYQTFTTVAGTAYRVQYEISDATATSSIRGANGSSPGDDIFNTSYEGAQTGEFFFTATGASTTIYLVCRENGGFSDFASVSVQEVGYAFSPADHADAFAVYDISNLSTLWQDTAGTTPAVVDSPVARVDDLTGNGHNLLQATGANQPTLRSGGGLYWLEFGESHNMTAAMDLSGGSLLTTVLGVRVVSTASVYFVNDINSTVGAGVYFSVPGSNRFIAYGNTPAYKAFEPTGTAPPRSNVIGSLLNGTAGTLSLRVDGVTISTNSSVATFANLPNDTMYIGSDYSGSYMFGGNLYGIAFYDAELAGDDLDAVEAFYAGKTGVTL